MSLTEVLSVLGLKVRSGDERRVQATVDRLAGSARNLAATFGLALGGREVVRGFQTMIELASDAAESANQLNAVFGDATDSVRNDLVELANVTQRSQFELQEFGAQAGALLTPLTGSAEQTRELSVQMVSLAQDLSSFFNARPEDAFRALRSAAIGSTEPLLTLAGIDLRVDALKRFAQETGRTFDELDTAGKTALRFELITNRLTDQGGLGDAIRTADEGANLFRGLGLMFKDVGTLLGQFLLPEAQRLALTFREMVTEFRDTSQEGGTLRRVAQGLADAFRVFGSVVQFLVANLPLIITLMAGLFVVMSPLSALVILLSGLFALLINDIESFGDSSLGVIEAVVREFEFLRDSTGGILSAISEMMETAVEFWVDQLLGVFGTSLDDVRRKINEFGSALGLDPGQLGEILAEAGRSVARPFVGPLVDAPGVGGLTQSQSFSTSVSIDASGNADPDTVRTAAEGGVRDALTSVMREARNAIVPSGG